MPQLQNQMMIVWPAPINLEMVTTFLDHFPWLPAQQSDCQRFLFLLWPSRILLVSLFWMNNQDRLLQSVQWLWGLIGHQGAWINNHQVPGCQCSPLNIFSLLKIFCWISFLIVFSLNISPKIGTYWEWMNNHQVAGCHWCTMNAFHGKTKWNICSNILLAFPPTLHQPMVSERHFRIWGQRPIRDTSIHFKTTTTTKTATKERGNFS